MTFLEAKQVKEQLDKAVTAASDLLQSFNEKYGKTDMGLTPDHVKAMPEWSNAINAYNVAAKKLQIFNRDYVKNYSKELREERKNKYKKLDS